MRIDFQDVLKSLARKHPIFTSERDLQFALGWHMKSLGWELHLEYEPGCFKRNASVDILVTRPELIAIELKYITVAFDHDGISLKKHPADVARYGVIADIQRLESILSGGRAKRGISILITNNPNLWSSNGVKPSNCDQFSIHEGRELTGLMSWSESAGARTHMRYPRITLRSGYKCGWFDYARIGTSRGHFRCLVTEATCLPPGCD